VGLIAQKPTENPENNEVVIDDDCLFDVQYEV
jgi:hypothetical protein